MRFALTSAMLVLAVPALAAPTVVPHRARYDVLTGEGAHVGTMTYAHYGTACSGYATESVTETSPGGRPRADTRMSFERPDGRTLEFGNTEEVDGRIVRDVHGTARRTDAGLEVSSSDRGRPLVSATYDGHAAFPVDFDLRVLAAAAARTPFVSGEVFDGSEDTGTRAPLRVTTTVAPREPGASVPKGLNGLRSYRLTTRVFPSDASGEQARHVMDSVEYENGVTTEIVERSEGHVLVMELADLELIPEEPCKGRTD